MNTAAIPAASATGDDKSSQGLVLLSPLLTMQMRFLPRRIWPMWMSRPRKNNTA